MNTRTFTIGSFIIRKIVWFISLFALVSFLTGCSQTTYYSQAIKGQFEIISKRQPIDQLLNEDNHSKELSDKWMLIKRLRRFAVNELQLPDNKSYTYYADLNRSHVVWNVVATERFSLSPKLWCYPIAGCTSYRGYFNQEDAVRFERGLQDEGYETLMYGVSAYSTLGWFSDPVLNTFIHYSETDLAGLIFHELAHQQLYIENDSNFNEAFATAVEIEGVRRWLNVNNDLTAIQDFYQHKQRITDITEMILEYREQLTQLYESGIDEGSMQIKKEMIIINMKQRYQNMADNGRGSPYFDRWFNQQLNNAHFISIATYYELVPAFTQLFRNSNYDFSVFFRKVKLLGELSQQERNLALQDLITDKQ